MTRIDAQGNLHDVAGKFTEKPRSAPSGALTEDAPVSALDIAERNYLDAQRALREELLAAAPDYAPDGATGLTFELDYSGRPMSAYWSGEGVDPVAGIEFLKKAHSYFRGFGFDSDARFVRAGSGGGPAGKWTYQLPSKTDRKALRDAMRRAAYASDLAASGSSDEAYRAASRRQAQIAADYLTASASDQRIRFRIWESDQVRRTEGVDFILDGGFDGKEYDSVGLSRRIDDWDVVADAVHSLTHEYVRGSGRFRELGGGVWELVGE